MPNPRDTVTVERVIPAPPERIFDVLADPARHMDIDGSGSLQGTPPDAPARLTKGSTFGMAMQRGFKYQMVNTVTEFEEGRRIAWEPRSGGRGAKFGGRVFRYELEPTEGGTRVRETWDISNEGMRFMLRYVAAKATKTAMTKTLERLEQVVSEDKPSLP
jgi:uncharacterized protein YndB with AHSA1/START domain